MRILVIEGPNINMLGMREPQTYGTLTMQHIHDLLSEAASRAGISVSFFQSNSEGELVTVIQNARTAADYIIINPAAYTHTSVAIRDAILAAGVPAIEVHLSNIFTRETFRHHSYISDIAVGVISGFREQGYLMALQYIIAQGART